MYEWKESAFPSKTEGHKAKANNILCVGNLIIKHRLDHTSHWTYAMRSHWFKHHPIHWLYNIPRTPPAMPLANDLQYPSVCKVQSEFEFSLRFEVNLARVMVLVLYLLSTRSYQTWLIARYKTYINGTCFRSAKKRHQKKKKWGETGRDGRFVKPNQKQLKILIVAAERPDWRMDYNRIVSCGLALK